MNAELTQQFPAPAMIPAGMGNGDWILLAPYGEHPHARGMQVFTPEDAAAVVADFSGFNIAKIFGLPWYIGHPDHPAFKERYKDTRAYGRITHLRAAADGLEGFVKFNRAGREIVAERAFHGHSINWFCRLDNRGRYRPASLKSVGWTNENNIPVPPILVANEDTLLRPSGYEGQTRHKTQDPELEGSQESGDQAPSPSNQEPTNTMNTKIRDQLILAGLLLPGETNPEAESAALQVLFDGWTERGQTVATLQGEVADLQSMMAAATTELGNERQARADAEAAKLTLEGERDTALANERTARAKADVAVLVSEGRLAPAGTDAAVEELANSSDYDTALAGYLQREPMKTAAEAKTHGLGGRSPVVRGAEQGLRLELANEISKKEGVDFQTAWSRLKARRKDLFQQVAGA